MKSERMKRDRLYVNFFAVVALIAVVIFLPCNVMAGRPGQNLPGDGSIPGDGSNIPDNGHAGEVDGSIALSTDKASYKTGEIIQIDASISGEGVVDLYMQLDIPEGSSSSAYVDKINHKPVPVMTNWAIEEGSYQYKMPVLPLFPEGDYSISMFMVQTGRPPVEKNRVGDSAEFHIEQIMEPFINVGTGEMTIPLGENGQIYIRCKDGEVYGVLTIEMENGNVYEKTMTGTYEVDAKNKEIRIYLEGEDGQGVSIVVSADNMILRVEVEGNRGNSGEASYNLKTNEFAYSLDVRDIEEIMDAMDVQWAYEGGAIYITFSFENPDGTSTEVTYVGTWEVEGTSLVMHVENQDDPEQYFELVLTANLDGTMTLSWTDADGNSGSKTFDSHIDLENYDPSTMTWSKEIKERGSFSVELSGENRVTVTVAICDKSGNMCLDKSAVVEYSKEDNQIFITATTENGRTADVTITNEGDSTEVEYSTGDGRTGKGSFDHDELSGNINADGIMDVINGLVMWQ
jgi:predicted RNA-binding protein with PUA domain